MCLQHPEETSDWKVCQREELLPRMSGKQAGHGKYQHTQLGLRYSGVYGVVYGVVVHGVVVYGLARGAVKCEDSMRIKQAREMADRLGSAWKLPSSQQCGRWCGVTAAPGLAASMSSSSLADGLATTTWDGGTPSSARRCTVTSALVSRTNAQHSPGSASTLPASEAIQSFTAALVRVCWSRVAAQSPKALLPPAWRKTTGREPMRA